MNDADGKKKRGKPLAVTDTTLRDAKQPQTVTRMTLEELHGLLR